LRNNYREYLKSFLIEKKIKKKARGNEYNIKPGELAWKQVVDITGKKIIADCGKTF
jgi:hypothetical protein